MNVNPEQGLPTYTDFKPPRGWIRWTAVVLALAGWWISLDLVKLSLGMPAGISWLQAECGPTADAYETLDCRSVLNSSWAWIPLTNQANAARIPVATFGMGYFAFVGLWYLFVGPPTRSRWARHVLISVVVVGGALVSLLMVHVMGSVLQRWCLGCVGAHLLNGGLLLLTILAFPWRRERAGVAPHPRGRLALATLAACTFAFLLHPAITLRILAKRSAARYYRAYAEIISDADYIRWQYERQPVQPLLAGEQPTHLGEPGAPNTAVVFGDFQCPVCKSACEMLERITQKYPGTLRVSCRHFPLDRECNDNVPRGAHPAACQASRAAEAARAVGGLEGFNQMRGLLYERADRLYAAPYPRWAAELGLDAEVFSEALESKEVARRVQEDIELGRQLGVEKIPVLFLNGRRLHYWSKLETWEALLALERAEGADGADDADDVGVADGADGP
jgi:protein-disulfide isomerase/uncharacterized membrane protein